MRRAPGDRPLVFAVTHLSALEMAATEMKMIGRVIGTVAATLLYGWGMMAYTPQATLITGQAAGHQLDNTDAGYLTAVNTMNFFSAIGTIMTVLFIGVLACIWFTPL